MVLAGAYAATATPSLAATKGGWTTKVFESFWRAPSAEVTRRATYHPQLTAWWPFTPGPLVGPSAYIKSVTTLLTLIPDVKLVVDDATDLGDVHFVRWTARGTPPVGPHEWRGAGFVRTRDGVMVENWIFSDHPVFQRLADEILQA